MPLLSQQPGQLLALQHVVEGEAQVPAGSSAQSRHCVLGPQTCATQQPDPSGLQELTPPQVKQTSFAEHPD